MLVFPDSVSLYKVNISLLNYVLNDCYAIVHPYFSAQWPMENKIRLSSKFDNRTFDKLVGKTKFDLIFDLHVNHNTWMIDYQWLWSLAV